MSDAGALMRAARTDPLAAQFAPQIGDFLSDVREIDQRLASALTSGSETDIAEARAAKREVMDELSNLLTTDVAKGFLEAAREEEEAQRQAQFQDARVEFYGSIQQDQDRINQRRQSDMAQVQQGLVSDLDREMAKVDARVAKAEEGLGEELTTQRIDEMRAEATQRAYTENAKRQAIVEDRYRMERIESMESSLLNPNVNPEVLKPLLEALWSPEFVEQRGVEGALAVTQTSIKDAQRGRSQMRKPTGLTSTTGPLNIGDISYAMLQDETLRSVYESPEALVADLKRGQYEFGLAQQRIDSSDATPEQKAAQIKQARAEHLWAKNLIDRMEIGEHHELAPRNFVWDRLERLVN